MTMNGWIGFGFTSRTRGDEGFRSSRRTESGWQLRAELSLRALAFARNYELSVQQTDGAVPGVIFGQNAAERHGNFNPLSYRRIVRNPRWARRLTKVHTAFKRSRARADWNWRELDCAHSSDALLMNIFCHPGALSSDRLRAILGIESIDPPQFGFNPRTPLANGKYDCTEIDMKLDRVLVEAKLTESDFQSSRIGLVSRYRDVETVFHLSELPLQDGRYRSYQLIRGTLAAHATGCSFCVFCDARRPDLIESWYRIIRAVRPFDLRYRMKLLTWQELSAALPAT
jgi:hypothetical protein